MSSVNALKLFDWMNAITWFDPSIIWFLRSLDKKGVSPIEK
jgi:hypothetical protein